MPRSILGLFYADLVYPAQLLHNTRSRVPVSSSTSVLVHFALIVGHRLCHAWSIFLASHLACQHQVFVHRHPLPVCTRHLSLPLPYAVATPPRPDLDHQSADFSLFSCRLVQTLGV